MTEHPPEIRQRFDGSPEQLATGQVADYPTQGQPIVIIEYDAAWVDRFAAAGAGIRAALGDLVAGLEHVGSTSVPGLAAKPVIDIDLLIGDTADETRYVPALEARGYRLVLREPWWQGHRMLVSAAGDVNLHVWPGDAQEPVRHRLFRDWLRAHAGDRELYAADKRRVARETVDRPGDYSLAKSGVIDEIFARIFATDGAAGRD